VSYDNWKMTEPYDPDADVPTCCVCDAPCDGTLHYLNRPRTEVYCPRCFEFGLTEYGYERSHDRNKQDTNK
jgi:hypothetical protein